MLIEYWRADSGLPLRVLQAQAERPPAVKSGLAAQLQSVVLDSLLAEGQPPIRRVKMVGALLDNAAAPALVAV